MTAIEAFESMKALIEKLQERIKYLEVEVSDLKTAIRLMKVKSR